MTIYDNLGRYPSRVIPIREGRVEIQLSGAGPYKDIGYCRIECDEPAAITVKTALGGRRVLGYNDRLEITWLQTGSSEMAALFGLQNGEHDIKLSRKRDVSEGGGEEIRMYLAYFMQLLPSLGKGEIKMIFEKQISVAEMQRRMFYQ